MHLYHRAPSPLIVSWDSNKLLTLIRFLVGGTAYCFVDVTRYFFLANLFLQQGISSEYVMVDFICMGLLDI